MLRQSCTTQTLDNYMYRLQQPQRTAKCGMHAGWCSIPSVVPLCTWLCPRAGCPGCSFGSHRSASAHHAGDSTHCSPCHSQSPGTSSCYPSEFGPIPNRLLGFGIPKHTCNVQIEYICIDQIYPKYRLIYKGIACAGTSMVVSLSKSSAALERLLFVCQICSPNVAEAMVMPTAKWGLLACLSFLAMHKKHMSLVCWFGW